MKGRVKDFRTLKVWHKATELTDTLYPLTAAFPTKERSALVDQLIRASQSIELNICESCGAESDADGARHLRIAMKSACEVEGGLDISRRQHMGPDDLRARAIGLVVEVKKMLTAYLRRMAERIPKRRA